MSEAGRGLQGRKQKCENPDVRMGQANNQAVPVHVISDQWGLQGLWNPAQGPGTRLRRF